MRNRKLGRVRFDKSNVDAPTVNRALDNIIDTLNPFMQETVENINNFQTAPAGSVDINAGTGISVVESPVGTFTITNTAPGLVQDVEAGAGISVVEAPTGIFTVTNTSPATDIDVVAGSGISVVESPTGTFTVTNIAQGGGGGGGGVLYYLNDAIAGDGPTPVANTKEFGLTIQGSQTTYTQLIPKNQPPQFVRGYISDTGNPDLTAIPAGLWEVNIWAINDSTQPDEVELSARVYVWNGTSLTQIGISAPNPMINGSTPTQYTLSVVVPQTATNATDRIYVAIYAQDIKGNDHNLTLYYGGIYPSHTHTTIPYAFVESITAGTGIIITEPNPNEYTITNAGALLSGPAQTFLNTNTFTANTNLVGPITTFDGAVTQLAVGRTFTNNGTFAGGTAAFTTYQNLPVQNLTAGTGISLSNTLGNWTITNTGGGPSGAKASVNFDPTPLVGAMQQTGNSIAISMTNNGMAVGDHFWLKDSTGTVDEYCVVASVITTTNFTATSPVSRTTGVIACTRTIWVRAEYNIASVEALVSPGSQPGWFNQVYRIYFTTNLGTDRYYPMCSSDLAITYNNQWAASIGPAYFYTPAPINSGAIWIGSPNTYPYNNVSLICY